MGHLYNVIRTKRLFMGPGFEGQTGLVVDFMQLMEDLFMTHEVTIPLVIISVFWMQSVAALQGDAGLSRNISLTIKHTEDLIKVMQIALPKHPLPVPVKGDSFHALLRDIMNGFKASLNSNLARANPLFAGSQMMLNHLEFLIVGSGHFSRMCRAFCHLYNALAGQGFLERIPFFYDMLVIYEKLIFSPSSRAEAVHGSYNRVYLLASRLTGTSIDAMYEISSTLGIAVKGRKVPPDPNLLSQTYRLMNEDMSFLKGASSKTILEKAPDVCTKEMFETRLLSRNLLTLTDDIKDLFDGLSDTLDNHRMRDLYMQDLLREEPHESRVDHALEISVMIPFMALIDGLQLDGSLDPSAVPTDLRPAFGYIGNGENVQAVCQKVAAVIKARFATPTDICERKYFTFAAKPDFANQVYGTASFKTKTINDNHVQVFSDLMKLLKESRGPLTGQKLKYLKEEIKKDPELLGMVTPTTKSRPRNDLCTLLHQAAAGPAHDAGLVEWLVQLGALYTQPLHCRKEPRQRDLTCPRKLLPNTMAVHSAAIAGYVDTVQILLEADNLVDLNTPTYHSKETLAHLAVKNGFYNVYGILFSVAADFCIKDGKGNNVCEVTTDSEWSHEIAAAMEMIERSCAKGRGRKDHEGYFRHTLSFYAEKLGKAVAAQRNEERRRATNHVAVPTPAESKTMKKNKKGLKGNGASNSVSPAEPEVDTTAMPDLLASLLGTPDSAANSKESPNAGSMLQGSIQKTAAAFGRLRDPNIPVADKADDVQYISKVIIRLDEAIKVQADPDKMIGTGVKLRIDLSIEASQLIHMMVKFNRVNHPFIAVPALTPVRELCATTIDFVNFVIRTAWVSLSVQRDSQAREIMDVFEKCLLKMPLSKREPSEFRVMVKAYSAERDGMGLGRTSSPDAFRRLEWYLSNPTKSIKQRTKLDKMAGRQLYFKLMVAKGTSDHQLSVFNSTMDSAPALDGVTQFLQDVACVVYGGTSKADVERVHQLVADLADRTGIKFDEQRSQFCTPTLHVGAFMFSAAGIQRHAAAA